MNKPYDKQRLADFLLELKFKLDPKNSFPKKEVQKKRAGFILWISSIKLKNLLSFSILTIALHIVTILNRTYYFNGRYFTDDQYHLLLSESYTKIRYRIAYQADVSYFYVAPDWIPNVFYGLYLMILILALIQFNMNESAIGIKEKPAREEGETG